MKKIFYLTISALIFLALDLILTKLLSSKLNLYDYFYPELNHRISNEDYHHSFEINVDTQDIWGPFKYKFITNSLGFKDKSIRNVENSTNLNKRIIIIGDSFTEGIGYKYEDTFVGLLDNKISNQKIEILNAGVASQSPIIYFKKIKHFIEVKKLKFNELIIFLDISDIPDEYFYNIYYEDEINKTSFRDKLQDLLIKNFSTYLFLDLLFSKLNFYKEDLILRYKASKAFNIKFNKVDTKTKNLYKSINVERGNWTHNISEWNNYGIKGRDLAKIHLDKLVDLCNKSNIKVALVIYPWPSQLYYDYEAILHRTYWKDWSNLKGIKFIDLFKYFNSKNPKKDIEKYFIEGDIHWNKNGHKYIHELILGEYFD